MRREFVRNERARGLAGAGGASGANGVVTVGAVLDAYLAAALSRGVMASQRLSVRALRPYWGSFGVNELTPDAIADWRDATAGRWATGTQRRHLSVLTTALAWASKVRLIPHAAPYIELPPAGASRSAYLDENLERELYALALGDETRDGRLSRAGRFICTALDTGARKAAIENLAWSRVDLVRGTVDFRVPGERVTKKRKIHTVVPDRLRPVLERALRERVPGSEYLLDDGRGRGSVSRDVAAFLDRHGFDGVTPHVFRHTRVTLLLRAGVSLWDVSALVGASPVVLQAVYGHHIQDDRLRAQANRVGA